MTGDPWNGRSLEWTTPSPPPVFNFAVLPNVEGVEAYWMRKQSAIERQALRPEPEYHDIEMPRNSAAGFICAFFATIMGFALIWHIWWLVAVAFVGAWAVFVVVRLARRARGGDSGGDRRAHRPGQSRRSRGRAADAEAGLVSAGRRRYPGGVAGGGLARGGGHAAALTEEPAHGPSKRIVVAYGFWIFLISDIILFSALFATYAVLTDATAGGPSGRDLFDLPHGRHRDRLPAALERVLRLRRHRRAGAAQRHVLRRDGGDVRARRDLRRDRAARVRDHDRTRAPARAAAPSCRRSSR